MTHNPTRPIASKARGAGSGAAEKLVIATVAAPLMQSVQLTNHPNEESARTDRCPLCEGAPPRSDKTILTPFTMTPKKSPAAPLSSADVYDQLKVKGLAMWVVVTSISQGPSRLNWAPVQAGVKLAGFGLAALPPTSVSWLEVKLALPPAAPVRLPSTVVLQVPGAKAPVKPLIAAALAGSDAARLNAATAATAIAFFISRSPQG